MRKRIFYEAKANKIYVKSWLLIVCRKFERRFANFSLHSIWYTAIIVLLAHFRTENPAPIRHIRAQDRFIYLYPAALWSEPFQKTDVDFQAAVGFPTRKPLFCPWRVASW